MRATPASVVGARRILCYGVTGSGKTTLARRLSELTGIPWHDADAMAWEPGWVEVPLAEQRRRASAVVAEERWILDTAYGGWLDVVLPQTDLMVALDHSRWVSLTRLLGRTAARLVDRRDVCNGNTESLRNLFGSNSILRWHFQSFRRKRERIAAWEADPRLPPVVRLRTPREARAWLASVSTARSGQLPD